MPIQMIALLVVPALALIVAFGSPASAADPDRLGAATAQVESGAKKVGEGISETASGVGQTAVEVTTVAAKTVVGTARGTARVVGRAGRNVGEGVTATWETVRDRLIDFGDDVVRLLKRPF